MKFTLFRAAIAVALLWGGGQGAYTALTNPSPAEVSVASFLESRPDTKWLRLTGGTLDLTELVYSGGRVSGEIKQVFLPLRAAASGDAAPVRILVSSKDPALLALATKLRDAKNELEALQVLVRREGVETTRSVEGLVQFGIDLKSKEQKKLRELNENLAADFVIVAEGGKPEVGVSFAMFGGGALLAFLLLRGLASPSAATTTAQPGAPAPAGADAPPPPPRAAQGETTATTTAPRPPA